jgi:hypothetical protein
MVTWDENWVNAHSARMANSRRRRTETSSNEFSVISAPKNATAHTGVSSVIPSVTNKRVNKFGAIKTEIDGMTMDSKREATTYQNLKMRAAAGEIQNLVADKEKLRYPLQVGDVLIGYYEADFRWTDAHTKIVVVADAKGKKTAVYQIKRKLMKAIFDIDILEL